MRGELDFAASLSERLLMLQGLPASVVDDARAQVTVTDSHGGATTHPLVLDVRNAPAPTASDRTASTPADTATSLVAALLGLVAAMTGRPAAK